MKWHEKKDLKSLNECADFFMGLLCDNTIFRYGREIRPALPHEKRELGCLWILTGKGLIAAKKLFEDIFPEGSDFEKDSGLIFD